MLGKAEGAESGFKGDLLSMAACVFYSAYILLTYRASGSVSSSAIMFVCSISTTAVLFIIGALAEGPEVPRTWAEIWAHTGNDSVAAGDRAEPPCPLPAQPEREPFIGHMPVRARLRRGIRHTALW